jgi:HAD superfamily hydrolase (TIGR01484 family)
MINGTYCGLFVTDLDGTLLTDQRGVRAEEMGNLKRLRQENIAVAIATGRSLFSFKRLLDTDATLKSGILNGVDFVIFSTGAGLLDFESGEILWSHSLGVDDVLDISKYLEELDVNYMVHAPIPETRKFIYRYRGEGNADFTRRIGLYRDFGVPVDKVSRECVSSFGGATEVLCIEGRERGHVLAEHIAEGLKEFSVIKAISPLDKQSVWIEIFHPHVSKSISVKWLARSIGLEQIHVCGVGNDYNDQDMLDWTSYSYIVQNGPKSMIGSYSVVSSNNDGGVSEAISRWLVEGVFK